jgi:hypothetical protein
MRKAATPSPAAVRNRPLAASMCRVGFTLSALTAQYTQNTIHSDPTVFHETNLAMVSLAIMLLDGRVRRAEDSRRTVLPDPGVHHPLRLGGEVTSLRPALLLAEP